MLKNCNWNKKSVLFKGNPECFAGCTFRWSWTNRTFVLHQRVVPPRPTGRSE